jgi:dihydrofolate synthase / folylpolyglutamate synthase
LDYREALHWIHSRERFGSKPGLGRIRYILKELSNPHGELKVIHIGGTNGKGSTAAFAASILRQAGFKTGLYTSPYLENFTNRMAVDGRDVADETLASLVTELKPLVEKCEGREDLGPPTEFEVVTALALLYFARSQVDYLVLEVGLGGRLDATNVVTAPLVSVITNVSLEHTDVLGDTVAKIAAEKAGIIKEGVPVLTASTDPEALAVLARVAREQHAPLYRMGVDYTTRPGERSLTGQYFDFSGKKASLPKLFIPLLGEHQIENAGTALAALELAGLSLPEATLRRGLEATAWPGRLEILREAPPVVIDAAHNPDSMRSLSRAMLDYFPGEHRVVVLGILGDKAIPEMLKHIIPAAHRFVVTRALHPTRAAEPEAVAAAMQGLTDKPVEALADLRSALRRGRDLAAAGGGALFITGSFYTISEARRLIVDEGVI